MSSRSKRKRTWRGAPGGAKRHHFVPAGYLANFAEPQNREGRLHVWDTQRVKSWVSTPDGVGWIPGLYQLDEGDPEGAEKGLRWAEGKVLPLVRAFASGPTRMPTRDEHDAVLSLVGLQHVRSPEVHDRFEQSATRIADLILDLSTGNPELFEHDLAQVKARNPKLKDLNITREKMRDAYERGLFHFEMNNGFVVHQMLSQMPEVSERLARLCIKYLWAPEGEEFVTSDRPIALIPRSDHPQTFALTIETAGTIFMPLGPRVLFAVFPHLQPALSSETAPWWLTKAVRFELAHRSTQLYSRGPLAVDPRTEQAPNIASTPRPPSQPVPPAIRSKKPG